MKRKIMFCVSLVTFVFLCISLSVQAETFSEQQIANYQFAYQTVMAYDDDGNIEYIGKSAAGTAQTTAAWQIQKITYDDNGNITSIDFAGDSPSFNKQWNLRESYNY
jgi:YD repeat-containing protein